MMSGWQKQMSGIDSFHRGSSSAPKGRFDHDCAEDADGRQLELSLSHTNITPITIAQFALRLRSLTLWRRPRSRLQMRRSA